jgi:hypothetical protein
MAISPSAPDYVSQVRGILGDAREDYLKKQQLFQQNEQANANLALQYAQLAMQKDNANSEAEYKDKVLEQNALQEQAKNETLLKKAELDARKDQYGMYKDSLAQNLNEKKFQLDALKEQRDAKKEADDLVRKKASGTRMAEFMKLASAEDYAGMKKWYADAEKDSFDLLDYQAMISNAKSIADNVQVVSDAQLVQNSMPDIQKFHADAENFQSNMESLSDRDREKGIAELQKRASILSSTLKDKNIVDSLGVSIASLNNKKKEVQGKEIVKDQDEFYDLAYHKRLNPTVQKKYDDLIARTPEANRFGEDWNRENDLLRLENNRVTSAAQLAEKAKELSLYEENQLQNPNFTVTNPDGTIRAAFQAPNLTPSFESGVLDKNNNISAKTQDDIKKYEDKVRSVGIMKQQIDPLATMATVMAESEARREAARRGEKYVPTTPSAQNSPQALDRTKARFSNQWAFLPGSTSNTTVVSGGGSPTPQPTAQPSTPETPTTQPVDNTDSFDYQRSVALLNALKKQKAENKKFVQNYDEKKKAYIDYINPRTNRPVPLDLYIANVENNLAALRIATFTPQNPAPYSILTPTQQPIGLQPVELTPASTIFPTE